MWTSPSPINEEPGSIGPAFVDQFKSLQAGAEPQNRAISRYYKTAVGLKRKGVMWDECKDSATAGWDYFGQVNVASINRDACPSPVTYIRLTSSN